MKIKNLIAVLRANKIRTGVLHYRYVQRKEGDKPELVKITRDNKKEFWRIEALGGETNLRLTYPNGDDYYGEAICSKRDAYEKRAGISLCAERIFAKRREEGKSNKLDGVEFV